MSSIPVGTVTVGEAILLHLNEYSDVRIEPYNMPFGMTQDGIAAAVRISRAHSSLELKRLMDTGHIGRKCVHVKGGNCKRYVHHLTAEGLTKAKQIYGLLVEMNIDPKSVFASPPAIADARDPNMVRVEDEIRLAIDSLEKSDRGSVIVHLSNAVRLTAAGMGVKI